MTSQSEWDEWVGAGKQVVADTMPESTDDNDLRFKSWGESIIEDIYAYGEKDARTQQSRQGILGPSDLGFCRNKSALVTKGVQPTGERNTMAAQWGTAIHEYVAPAIQEAHEDWHAEDNQRLTATLPSGVTISGTPDIVTPMGVIDIKTVDGLEWVEEHDVTENHDFQTLTYNLAAIQAGLLDPSEPIYTGILYLDRSARSKRTLFKWWRYDPQRITLVDNWIGDVIYAVKNGEDAMRDVEAAVCEKICEFFPECRGNLPVEEGVHQITDPLTLDIIDFYIAQRAINSKSDRAMKEAKIMLEGVNGTTGKDQVRWVEIGETQVKGFTKKAHKRLDIRPIPKGK